MVYVALLPTAPADAQISAASSRLNRRPCRFKWTRLFRRKTKCGFCPCAITFQLARTLNEPTSPAAVGSELLTVLCYCYIYRWSPHLS